MTDRSINPVPGASPTRSIHAVGFTLGSRNRALTLKGRRILAESNSSIGPTGVRQPWAAYRRSHRRCRMDYTPSQKRFGLLRLVGLAAVAILTLSGGSSAVFGDPPSSTGAVEPSVVVTGGYSCTVSETTYLQLPSS